MQASGLTLLLTALPGLTLMGKSGTREGWWKCNVKI